MPDQCSTVWYEGWNERIRHEWVIWCVTEMGWQDPDDDAQSPYYIGVISVMTKRKWSWLCMLRSSLWPQQFPYHSQLQLLTGHWNNREISVKHKLGQSIYYCSGVIHCNWHWELFLKWYSVILDCTVQISALVLRVFSPSKTVRLKLNLSSLCCTRQCSWTFSTESALNLVQL